MVRCPQNSLPGNVILIRIILKMIFYHNTEIFSTLIGRALWPIRVQILWKRRRDCGAIGFSLSRARDFPGLQRKWTQKTLTVIGGKNNNKQTNKSISNNFQWSILLTTIEMTSKCSNLAVKLLAFASRFHLSF